MSICRGEQDLEVEIREEFLFTTMQDHKMQTQRFTKNGCKRIRWKMDLRMPM